MGPGQCEDYDPSAGVSREKAEGVDSQYRELTCVTVSLGKTIVALVLKSTKDISNFRGKEV